MPDRAMPFMTEEIFHILALRQGEVNRAVLPSIIMARVPVAAGTNTRVQIPITIFRPELYFFIDNIRAIPSMHGNEITIEVDYDAEPVYFTGMPIDFETEDLQGLFALRVLDFNFENAFPVNVDIDLRIAGYFVGKGTYDGNVQPLLRGNLSILTEAAKTRVVVP
jgi:hypothetical protein